MSNRAESYLVGLVGDGVMPSLTPPMHEREGDVQGLRYLYRTIDLLELGLPGESVGELLQSAHRMGFNGLNITHPCKQLVLDHLDEIAPDARRLGAVNTVTIRDGRFIGHNTDFSGFAAALASDSPMQSLTAWSSWVPAAPGPPSRTPCSPPASATLTSWTLTPPAAPNAPRNWPGSSRTARLRPVRRRSCRS